VVFRLHNRSEAILTLKKKGEGWSPRRHRAFARREVIGHACRQPAAAASRAAAEVAAALPGNMRYLPEETKGIGRIVLDASFARAPRFLQLDSARVEQRTTGQTDPGHRDQWRHRAGRSGAPTPPASW
jgi:DNA-directed RNA polymerase subunit alpha